MRARARRALEDALWSASLADLRKAHARPNLARTILHLLGLRIALPGRLERENLRTLVEDLTDVARPQKIDTRLVEDVERVVSRTMGRARPLHTTCLFRSLVRHALLRRAGLDVRFVMGVRPGEVDIAGHAWLELDGRPYKESLEHEYRETFRWPS